MPWAFLMMKLATIGWIGVCLTVVSGLMADHWIALPTPPVGSQMPIGDGVTTDEPSAGNVTVLHFLYDKCPCSQRVLQKLLARRPVPGACETIVLIGETPTSVDRAERSGYRCQCVTPARLKATYGVESAPLLLAIDENRTVLYSGGYTARKRGYAILDVDIIQSLLARKHTQSLPVYGCATSQILQDAMDPLRLKYRRSAQE